MRLIISGTIMKKKFRLRDRFGTMQVVHPDFTIPCSDGSFILVEHAGCMDKDGYFTTLHMMRFAQISVRQFVRRLVRESVMHKIRVVKR